MKTKFNLIKYKLKMKARRSNMIKTCVTCGKTHPLSNYNLNTKEKDGHSRYCRDCVKIKNTKNHLLQKKIGNKTSNGIIPLVGGFRVNIKHNGKSFNFGTFETEQEAEQELAAALETIKLYETGWTEGLNIFKVRCALDGEL